MSILSRASAAGGALTSLLLGLAGGGLIALAPDIALPLGVLLIPGLAALIFDSAPGRAVSRAMLLLQAAACVRPGAYAWNHCEGTASCMAMLANPQQVVRIWMIAAIGWILTQILPAGLKYVSDYRVRQRRTALQVRRTKLAAEWGLDGEG